MKICAEKADLHTGHSFVSKNLELLQVETYKYLDVLIDVNLNFQSQHTMPVLEYTDLICDQGLTYINKSIQKLQNWGLSIAFNQHILPYHRRDSSDPLHRWSGLFRLVHRRKLHLLQFAFSLKLNVILLDNRDIPTRRRDGILVKIPKSTHYN